MSLYIRLSDTDIHFALYDSHDSKAFQFTTYHLRPQISLTMNLRNALDNVALLRGYEGRVDVLVNTPVTPVPLADFQEEDCATLYDYCFTEEERHRVFYDTIPAANAVLLFGLGETVCHAIEDAFGDVRFSSSRTALLQHLATKALGASGTQRRRLFIYTHEGMIDIAVFDDTRLLMFNTYTVRTLTDVAYYTFYLARHLGFTPQTEPIYVAGEELLRTPVVEELQKYAKQVFAINPAADFNRHVAATTAGIPYDMTTHILNKTR